MTALSTGLCQEEAQWITLLATGVRSFMLRLPQGKGEEADPGKKHLMPAPNVKHVHFSERSVQADIRGCAFEA